MVSSSGFYISDSQHFFQNWQQNITELLNLEPFFFGPFHPQTEGSRCHKGLDQADRTGVVASVDSKEGEELTTFSGGGDSGTPCLAQHR